MKRKRLSGKYMKSCAACFALMLTMTGCGNKIPELTDEEMELIGEYAAITLMKYDANNRSRLVDAAVLESAEWEKAQMQEETQIPEETQISEESAQKIPSETGRNDSSGNSMTAKQAGEVLQEYYQLPEGIEIEYKGYHVCTSYPENTAEGEYFALDAAEGKVILALEFEIRNESDKVQELDLFRQDAAFLVTVNDSFTRNTLTTMLEDDLSAYENTLQAGEEKNAVLLLEVAEEQKEISAILLRIRTEESTYKIQLL